MLVEATILDIDDGVLHRPVDLIGAVDLAGFGTAQDGQNGLAVAGENAPVDVALLELSRVELAQAAAQRAEEAEAKGDEREHAEHADKREQSQLANSPLWPGRALPA